MTEPDLQATDDTTPPARPDRWDEAVVASYIYDLAAGAGYDRHRTLPHHRARRALHRDAHDRSGLGDRERRARADSERPWLLAGRVSRGSVNAYLIPFGGLLLLAGRLGDLGRTPKRLPGRPRGLHRGLACLRPRPEPGNAGRRAAGCRAPAARSTSSVILGIIITMFTEPREQAKAIGVFSFVASAGASIGLLAGGILTQGHRLALDLLRERADRRRRPLCSPSRYVERDQGPRSTSGRRRWWAARSSRRR